MCSRLSTDPSRASRIRPRSSTITVIRMSYPLLLFLYFGVSVMLPANNLISCHLHTAPSGSLTDYSPLCSRYRQGPCSGRGPLCWMRTTLRRMLGNQEGLLLISLGRHLAHRVSLLLPGRPYTKGLSVHVSLAVMQEQDARQGLTCQSARPSPLSSNL